MKKTIQIIVMAALCLNFNLNAQVTKTTTSQRNVPVKGKVVDEGGLGIPGVSIKLKGTARVVSSNTDGDFIIDVPENTVLQISHIGYISKEVTVNNETKSIRIFLKADSRQLKEVTVSTGYQTLPRERATGSFEVIDNKLFNRTTGTDVFSRLDGITTGILFDKNNSGLVKSPYAGMRIRGISGFRGTKPLIVVDNFPYEGDPNNLNPNDVESITILKDAAAASIWGTRAGNGVIVITTKKGKLNQSLRLSLNSNVTVMDKPDLHYLKTMNSSDLIDVEIMLFNKGHYDSKLDPKSPFSVLTPVIELLAKTRPGGSLNLDQAKLQIDALRNNDVRDDFLKYLYRKGINQQYALNALWGDAKSNYSLSLGYDKNLESLRTNDYNRITVRFNSTIKPLKNLELETGVFYIKNNDRIQSTAASVQYGNVDLGSERGIVPYAMLADDQGNPLPFDKNFRGGYTDTVGYGRLLDWKYRPLEDMKMNSNIGSSQDILLNFGARYTISPILTADLKYQYEKTNGENNDLYGRNSFYVRNQVNAFTQFNKQGITLRPMPLGDILTRSNHEFNAHTLRGLINLNKTWNDKHQLAVLTGTEIRETHSIISGSRLYGYDPNTLTFQNVDFVTVFPLINREYGAATIKNVDQSAFNDNLYRFVSLFANASYTYHDKYIVSLSARKDQANLFGVASNKRGTPLWSAGTSWVISKEGFYNSELLPYLRLRMTYGHSGRAEESVPAYATVSYLPGSTPTNYPYALSNNPPNSQLRWEKIGMFNLGLDYSFRNNRITGSVEYYNKRSKDLIAAAPVDPSTGFQSLLHNSAEIHGQGVDVQLNTINLPVGDFQWTTNLLFSYNKSIVAKYFLKNSDVGNYVRNGGRANAVVGMDYYALYAYPFAGLDPTNGDPMGYLNGEPSKAYVDILRANAPISDIKYFGSTRPRYFGAVRNDFSWKGFSLSMKISYRFDYFFRREGINYGYLFDSSFGHADFANRWQQPGDEKRTTVPSMIYGDPVQYYKDQFYALSSALIEKGDNIRLDDVNLSYTFPKQQLFLKELKLFANVYNVGILWKANKVGLDPDYGTGNNIPPSRTMVFGLTANF
ncbi:SusC/RagA family TonB-linked outer membrane protein [Pedobacter gandavensis]|uniref:SusC/RagA family TonB-linked outer membrane protein n=1 Tax=Pedobacter gandavensis TaxID=2679963 RepID=UPI00292E6A1C|nr:SusC/RagA family TonB-linked outer membrane protein [Pedobacter gandavensis]